MTDQANNWPKLHNATWPGVVGKGPDADEPFIDLDTMLDMTAKAEVGGVKFDGFDLFLSAPHFDIDSGDTEIAALVDKARGLDREIGTVIAPVWPPTGGVESMQAVAEHAGGSDLVLGIEFLNRFEIYLLNTATAAQRFVEAVGDPRCGVLYDTFHANIEENPPAAPSRTAPPASAMSILRKTTAAHPDKAMSPGLRFSMPWLRSVTTAG